MAKSKKEMRAEEMAISEQALETEMQVKLPITNDFMFNRVMRHAEVCKAFLEDVLPELKIKALCYLETQKTLENAVDARGIRLDVYSEDSDKVYNIELQRANLGDLPRRTRYYQGQIDMGLLEKGVDYEELKDCYIIFVCTFDLFSKGHYRYTFENRCLETGLPLNDGTFKIFLNTKGKVGEISEELKVLLDYFENKPIPKKTELVEKIDALVKEANYDKEWRRQVMMENLKYRDERKLGRMEGIQEGEQKNRYKTALKMLGMQYPPTLIGEITGLSEAEILSIKQEMKKA